MLPIDLLGAQLALNGDVVWLGEAIHLLLWVVVVGGTGRRRLCGLNVR